MPPPPSTTPREKRTSEYLRSIAIRAPASPLSRIEHDKAALAASGTPDEDDDADSPSPRGKRPRMLDFTMAATPVHHMGSCAVLDQVQSTRAFKTGW
jgi:hypothetical protein